MSRKFQYTVQKRKLKQIGFSICVILGQDPDLDEKLDSDPGY